MAGTLANDGRSRDGGGSVARIICIATRDPVFDARL